MGISLVRQLEDSNPPAPSAPKGNRKFEILLVKIFSVKAENKIKYFQVLQKKLNFYFQRKQSMVPLDKELYNSQVDSPELLETPEITEIKKNFTKVTKYLTKFKETLRYYVWEKSHVKKQ